MTTTRDNVQRARYFTRCLVDRFRPSLRRCPCCGGSEVSVIKSKRLVTSLVRCCACQLLFRIPQDRPEDAREFYQEEYESGFTTTLPSDEALREMQANQFRGTEKCLRNKLDVLRALDVRSNGRVLDFGASWGYGTWQLREAGFEAEGFEISRPRAAYGRDKLGVPITSDEDALEGPFDVFLSIHVLEHLPSPTDAFDLARRLLGPGGLFIAYTPNGSSACMQADPDRYHRAWGRLHPLYLDERFYCDQLPDRPKLLTSCATRSQIDLSQLQTWDRRSDQVHDLTQSELLAVIVF